MKTIAIVATGGTIAGTGKKGKTAAYHAGEIDIDSIIETIPEINEVAHIKEYQLMNIDSNEMTHEKWLILKIILKKFCRMIRLMVRLLLMEQIL